VLSKRGKVWFTGSGDLSPYRTRGGKRLHILVVNFNLKGMSEEDYRGLVEPIAPAFAGLPGLLSKTWLANAETNTYGGVYVWQDRGAMEAYKQTDIYKGMRANPSFENVTVTDFAVVENATRITRGPVEVA
jgi:quinol monooxygenase YgiN